MASVHVGKRTLEVSNLDKVLYPKAGITKAHVIDFYRAIGPALLPHLKDRPLTLKRYPEGVEGEFFYQKDCPPHRPGWVKTAPVWSEGRGSHIRFCVVNDLATLIWAANLADLELHTSLAVRKNIERPTVVAFDLDPGAPANLLDCCKVGLLLRDVLARLDLDAYPKTSGSKGLQVYVPLNTDVSYDETKGFAHALARWLEKEHPDLVVSTMRKSARQGKVFVDWSQNDRHKTTVCVYSLRAKDRPTVSTPLSWREVEAAVRAGSAKGLVFEMDQVVARVKKHRDLFAPVLKQKQRLPTAKAAELEEANP